LGRERLGAIGISDLDPSPVPDLQPDVTLPHCDVLALECQLALLLAPRLIGAITPIDS
jgi:hypothetical protein